jgi:glucose-1-phosphate adenylyltransferase
MIGLHGIVYAFHSFPELGVLQTPRTAASLPFAGRYRLIDFSLSSMTNCGIRDVGVIMQRDYQSLLDHLRGGKEWDLSRRDGGLRMLPPFGLPSSHLGEYKGCMEALATVRSYLGDIRQKYILLTRGDLVANIDLSAVYASHLKSKAGITAVCTDNVPDTCHHRYLLDKTGCASDLLCRQKEDTGGVTAMEVYIVNKNILLELVDYCSAHRLCHFHRDAVKYYFSAGGKMNVYMHEGYNRHIVSVQEYFIGSMDMLRSGARQDVFNMARPVSTREHADMSTYYGEKAAVRNSLIADGCRIDGEAENCIIFRGSVVEEGAKLKNCIIMQNTVVGRNTRLTNLISDKDAVITGGMTLAGGSKLPLIIPKGTRL